LVLMRSSSRGIQRLGKGMVRGLPILIRVIGAVGTAALILVAGGIFHHHLPHVHHWVAPLPGLVADTLLGLTGGAMGYGVVLLVGRIVKG
jgi:predicted DNA repair protein MutK